MSTIGDRIAYRRKQLGLTQQDLADKIGLKSKSAINKIELGKVDVSQSKVFEISVALDCEPGWLLGLEEGNQIDPKRQELIDYIKNLPLEKIESLYDFLIK